MGRIRRSVSGFEERMRFAAAGWRRKANRRLNNRALRLECLENRCLLSITVNTLADENDVINNGTTSLREAIAAVTATNNVINFDSSVLGLNGGTITLVRGEIEFTKSLTIDASTLSLGITIDANDPTTLGEPGDVFGDGNRVFNIADTSFGASPPLVVDLPPSMEPMFKLGLVLLKCQPCSFAEA